MKITLEDGREFDGIDEITVSTDERGTFFECWFSEDKIRERGSLRELGFHAKDVLHIKEEEDGEDDEDE